MVKQGTLVLWLRLGSPHPGQECAYACMRVYVWLSEIHIKFNVASYAHSITHTHYFYLVPTAPAIITPRACARGKVIGFVCRRLSSSVVVNTKIARSGDLGI